MHKCFHRPHPFDDERARSAFGPGRPPFPPGFPPFPGGFRPEFGWGHGHRRGGPGRRGRRGKRGNIRAGILALLRERPMHGYEMIQELEERTDGVWRPSPGSVYPTLQLLEDEGLITGEKSQGKRLYSLTDSGREQAEQQPSAPWDEVAAEVGPGALELRQAIASVTGAAGQVMLAGNEEQQAKALQVLADARRRLYGILAAEDDDTDEDGDEPANPDRG